MTISKYIMETLKKGSIFREVFESTEKLTKKFGADKVYNFSIGNPSVPPTKELRNAIKLLANDNTTYLGYSAFAGLPALRKKLAEVVSKEQGVNVKEDGIIVSCGATGALNVIIKALSNPEDEFILIAPFFGEYIHYLNFHSCKPIIVDSNDELDIDISKIEKAITEKTKAIILNSPNNPSGKIYSKETLEKLAKVLKNYKQKIYIISDEPYRYLNYEKKVPSIFQIYENSIITNSCAKDMSIPGARIGWVAINPSIIDYDTLKNVCFFANSTLYCCPPVFMQQVVLATINYKVDVNIYKKKREALFEILKDAGYDVTMPDGTFYFFVKSPITDDVKFCKILLEYNIVCIPGTSFSKPNYFRISYCCSDETIINSRESFKKAFKKAKNII
jgi:aspartate aminotransferase